MTGRLSVNIDEGALEQIRRAAAQGLADGAEYLMEEANRTVPFDEATLEGSGHVVVDDAALEAAVAYDTPYAIRQHEDLTLRHSAGRRAKWLEHTMKERGREAMDHVADRIRRATGG